MRKFLITSPQFSGSAAVVYDQDGKLVLIDFTECNMTTKGIDKFKARVPALLSELTTAFVNPTTQIVESEYEVHFEDFWKKYDKKINKARCVLLWGKMDKTQQVLAFMGINAYDRYLRYTEWRSKADPETYLRNRYWENEYKLSK